jgi:hypothetical protein
MVLLIAALVLEGSLGTVYAVGLNSSKGQRGESAMSQNDLTELRKLRQQFKEQPEWGFISREGRTGRIESIEGNLLMAQTPKGALQAQLGEMTTVGKARGETLTLADLTAGMLVTVNGEFRQRGVIKASEILVIPEGEGGFTIRPRRGDGPNLVPVFP